MCPESARPIITLLTDFGEEDGYVASMKGVVLGIAPHARLVDVGHYLPSYQVTSAAYVLCTYYEYFPMGSVHMAVVDPGVGGNRKAVVVHAGGHYFVVPDNGIATYVIRKHTDYRACEIVEPKFQMPKVSATFHGRDIFAPVAAHLATGTPFEEFGPVMLRLVELAEATPAVEANRIRGSVIHIDRFGNFITNIRREHIETLPEKDILCRIKRFTIVGLSRTFSDRERGEPLVYVGSSGFLEIGVYMGSASRTIPATIGDEVTIWAGRQRR